MEKTIKKKHPLFWIPSTFFMEGLAGTYLMVVAGIMYKNLGLSNTEITMYTGLLTLPFSIRPLWASFIDVYKTKRWWISTMEILIGAIFVGASFALHTPMFFTITIVGLFIMAFLCTSHDMAADGNYIVELEPYEQSKYLGFQGASYQAGKIVVQGALLMLSGYLFSKVHNYFTVWSIVLLILAVICIALGVYNRIMLPKGDLQVKKGKERNSMIKEFGKVYVDFFKIKGLWIGIIFLLLYKLGETLLMGVFPLFLVDPVAVGGLGLTNTFTGFSYGTVAPIALLFAGFLGGFTIYKFGLKRCIWGMVIVMNLPHLLYVYLGYFQPQNHILVLSFIAIEQFCFAFGYSAYTFFLMYLVRDSEYKTSHYAFFAGIMMLGLMLPKMVSGWVQSIIGYEHFFILVFLMFIPSVLAICFLKIDANFGKKDKKTEAK